MRRSAAAATITTQNRDMPADDYECGGPGIELHAVLSGSVAGSLSAAVRNDHLRILGVDVDADARRQGVGSRLVRELVRRYPKRYLSTGSLTADGHELFASLAGEQIVVIEEPDPAFEDDE